MTENKQKRSMLCPAFPFCNCPGFEDGMLSSS
jgi:hypothetical protein